MISSEALAALSPRQRELLERRLAELGERRPSAIPRRPAAASGDPLSFAQQRLWFVDQLESGSPFLNVTASVTLEGELRAELLGRALAAVAERHEILRTTFEERAGRPVQRVGPARGAVLTLVDLRRLEDPRGASRRAVAELAARPFDLAGGPIFRALLARAGEHRWAFVCAVHHIAADGASLGVLLRELVALYGAFAAGRPSPLTELPIQYRDFAVWQRERLDGAALETQLDAWRKRLAGAPAFLPLPTDRPRPRVQGYRGERHLFEVPAELRRRLEALATAEGTTLFTVVFAAFQLLVAELAGVDDVVVSTPLGGRDRPETRDLVGCFVNTLLVRAELSGDLAFRDHLRRTHRELLDAYTHQEAPLDRVIEELAPERSLGYNPFLQASLNFIDREPLADTAPPGLELGALEVESGRVQHELNFILGRQGDGLLGKLEYKTELFDAATAEVVIARFRRLLEAVADDPGARRPALAGEMARAVDELRSAKREHLERRIFAGLGKRRAPRSAGGDAR